MAFLRDCFSKKKSRAGNVVSPPSSERKQIYAASNNVVSNLSSSAHIAITISSNADITHDAVLIIPIMEPCADLKIENRVAFETDKLSNSSPEQEHPPQADSKVTEFLEFEKQLKMDIAKFKNDDKVVDRPLEPHLEQLIDVISTRILKQCKEKIMPHEKLMVFDENIEKKVSFSPHENFVKSYLLHLTKRLTTRNLTGEIQSGPEVALIIMMLMLENEIEILMVTDEGDSKRTGEKLKLIDYFSDLNRRQILLTCYTIANKLFYDRFFGNPSSVSVGSSKDYITSTAQLAKLERTMLVLFDFNFNFVGIEFSNIVKNLMRENTAELNQFLNAFLKENDLRYNDVVLEKDDESYSALPLSGSTLDQFCKKKRAERAQTQAWVNGMTDDQWNELSKKLDAQEELDVNRRRMKK